MVFQDPYFHAFRRKLAATPYEEARRRLTTQLQAAARTIARPPHLSADEIEQRERWLYREGLDLYLPILRTVYRAIAREVAAGLVEPEDLDAEELAFATYQRALDEIRRLPHLPRDRFAWLRHLARDTVHRVALERHSQRHRPSETRTPPAPQEHRPPSQPVLARLEAVFGDPDLPLPDDLLQDEAARRILDSLLERLPDQWRELYLLSVLDRWDDERIAAVTGLLPDEVRAIVRATARFLHAWLHELASEQAPREG
ncbi:hypothetical protein OO015_02170 [Thermomicrobium sp. 4228-Ro]|uniref:hypothetical protein n=1 Tax=Thermomicrobium sp. 4228-Ro TaxID=2993937 RepID=UPI0022499FBA|nr:hypothetical protein [Thermomicrobium sp. 4228-Ro]MCX2726297.1 hypothetical protein [Thermomicrobium sp. 4228-Ro]